MSVQSCNSRLYLCVSFNIRHAGNVESSVQHVTKYVKFHLKLRVISNTVCKYDPATKANKARLVIPSEKLH
jgi:hypothetical protein